MLAEQHCEEVLAGLLARAQEDPQVHGVAITGSATSGASDRWSDIDLFLGVDAGAVTRTLQSWSDHLYAELGALHHFDLHAGSAHYRAFLLPDLLEIDLGFTPIGEWRPLGDGSFQVVFGEPAERAAAPVDRNHLIGLAWHHIVHVRVALERDKLWEALHWVNALRDHAITLASLRLGLPSAYAKGAHLLPEETTDRLSAAIPGALTSAELTRALGAATQVLTVEVRAVNPVLADRLVEALSLAWRPRRR